MKGQYNISSKTALNINPEIYPSNIPSEYAATLLKTVLPETISKNQLNKLTSIHHPYLINAKKVVKMQSSNQYPNEPQKSYYAIYYQSVVAGKPSWKNIAPQLQSIVRYLISNEIYYPIRKKDIIFNLVSEMRVFIPPTTMVGIGKKYSLSDMQEGYNEIMNWCEKEKNQQSLIRMEKIDRQIKQIKQKLTQKHINIPKNFDETKNRLANVQINQTQKKLIGNKQRTKTENLLQQITQMGPSRQSQQFHVNYPIGIFNWRQQPQSFRKTTGETIQQNINCINIYHTNQYDIPYINRKNIGVYEAEDTDSLDTYQKELGELREMPKIFVTKLRHTVLPISQQYSRQGSRSLKKQKNKVVHDSPRKQFSEIIKGAMSKEAKKQQIRKSNIFEQELESSVSSIKIKNDGNQNQLFASDETLNFPQIKITLNSVSPPQKPGLVQIQKKVNVALNKTKAAIQTLKKVRNNTSLNKSK